MKRILLITCAFLLMIDLAADGRLGTVKFVSPKAPAHSSLASSPQSNSAKVESQVELPLTNLGSIPGRFASRHPILPGPPALKIIDACHFNSSGGIPL